MKKFNDWIDKLPEEVFYPVIVVIAMVLGYGIMGGFQ